MFSLFKVLLEKVDNLDYSFIFCFFLADLNFWLVEVFKFETDISDVLVNLRCSLPEIFGYEDCALLIQNVEGKNQKRREKYSTHRCSIFSFSRLSLF